MNVFGEVETAKEWLERKVEGTKAWIVKVEANIEEWKGWIAKAEADIAQTKNALEQHLKDLEKFL